MTILVKDVKHYEGIYTVSSDGKVFSLTRKIHLKSDKSSEYQRVTLSKDSITTRYFIHRLVAEAFIPNPDKKPFINHIDNDPTNNNVENLEWCTHSENMIHAHKQGRLANIKASHAAVDINYTRYGENHKERLGARFIGYFPFKQIISTPKPLTKSQSALKYICRGCEEVRIALVGWSEIRVHKGLCPNCQSIVIVVEDIV